MLAIGRFGRLVDFVKNGGAAERGTVVFLVVVIVWTGAVLFSRKDTPSQSSGELLTDREVQWGLAIVAMMVLVAVYAPIISPHDPQYALYGRLRDFSSIHWFGTDSFGRDAFSRIVYGARISLVVALSATLISLIVGVLTGLSSALSGDKVDSVIMRVVDAGIAFPRAFLLLALFALSPQVNLPILIIILGMTSWFDIARLARAEVLSIRNVEYVVATTGLGFKRARTMLQHVLPNVAGPIIVSATLTIGYLILIESGLSYIGVGLQAGTPSWGILINEGYAQLRTDPHLTLVPGALIATTVVGFSLIGDGLRRSLDPHRT